MIDKRFVLALLLTGVVVFVTPVLFPTPRTARPIPSADSAVAAPPASSAPPARTMPEVTPPPGAAAPVAPGVMPATRDTGVIAFFRAETTLVATPRGTYRFSSAGGALIGVTLADHRNLRDSGPMRLEAGGQPLLRYRLAGGPDSTALSRLLFRAERGGTGNAPVLTYRAQAAGRDIELRYTFAPDSYVVRLSATIRGAQSNYLAVDLPSRLQSFEADTVEDARQLAYVYKPQREGARSVGFGKLEPGDRRVVPGPITWAATKTKYFIVGVLSSTPGTPFSELDLAGAPRTSKLVTEAHATVLVPLASEQATFEIYAGPQEWKRLLALGRGFEDANPYGGWFSGVVQPFATIVMRVLLWMRGATGLSYGWVLVIFGLVIRIAMWPLQQKSMRVSIQMQRIQPELQIVQTKWKNDPQKLQQEMMRVYKEHGMSPFSTFSGCLPMLLPMPILFALFFVFQNTIEFRGVPFLWLPDISLKDPYYIVPLLMGASMFLLSWIGLRGAPPNPQSKMMAYIFPPMMTFLFLNFASGLNLYYFVQNVAALPQQWLLIRERAKMAPPSPPPKAT